MLMKPNKDLPPPTLNEALWVIILVLAIVVAIGAFAPH